MTTNTNRRFARFFAIPIVAGGILAGALGLAGTASAGTYTPDNTPRPGIVAIPQVTAPSAGSMTSGHRIDHLQTVQPSYHP
ncbi:hypothetical protein [Mycobacterium sp. E740]|uniref:hypothetical protein n=1 Tax=Mycobacterium sp. E740 TaxID=1834149 RepID=UPI000801AF73|nr:hypothetical protein [Mycobacterium sp. E740]OBI81163.1 hypothetical protein A5663_16545 [Mycobacterium sp. E740]